MRIRFNASGPSGITFPEYAVLTDADLGEPAAVARAIAAKNGWTVITLRGDGHGITRGVIDSDHYSATLGVACRGGGWTPRAEVHFSIPATGTRDQAALRAGRWEGE